MSAALRGQLVAVAARGPFTGKPRPALVIQAAPFDEVHPSVTVCLVTSELRDAPLFRVPLPSGIGLAHPSQVMVDKLVTVPRDRLGNVIGQLDDGTMLQVERALRMWLGL